MNPALNDDENEATNKWLIAQNQNDPFGGGQPLSPVSSPTPKTPISPVDTNTGSPEDDNGADNNDSRIKDSHPGHSPEDLTGYIKAQEGQIDKYGPDQEAAVLKNIADTRNSWQNKVARGGATFADAIMQGVARAGNPGFASQLQERENRAEDLAKETIPTLNKLNQENMGAKERLEGMTSGTPLGASQTAPLAAFFERMGVPKAEIPKLLQNPAAARSVIEPFATVMSKDEQIKMEMLLKQLEIAQRTQGMQNDATKTLAGQGIVQKLANKFFNPGVNEKLEQEAGVGTNNGGSSQKTGPLGPTTLKGGKTYEWSAQTGKYHLKR